MKISLLLDREPFGEIVEETLSRHLSAVDGEPRKVIWVEGGPKTSELLAKRSGLWLCNPKINAIYSVSAGSRVFEVPWREYLGGASIIKVGAHASYLTAASVPLGRWALASHHLWIDPDLENASSTLILGGNSRIRLIDYDRQLVTTILKSRFDTSSFDRELEFRQARANVLAPPVVEVLEDGRAFVEPLIHGTNADRVINKEKAEAALISALTVCSQMGRDTARVELVDEWVGRMLGECRAAAEYVQSDPSNTVEGALDLASKLGEKISRSGDSSSSEIEVGVSHGDLQRGNVLVEGDKTWLIDWERVGVRVLGYDGLTLALDSRRSCDGLLERAKQLVAGERADAIGSRVNSELAMSRGLRSTVGQMLPFFLEEIRFHLEENAMGPLTEPTSSLRHLVAELEALDGDAFWNVG